MRQGLQGLKASFLSCQRRAEAQNRGHDSRKKTRWQGVKRVLEEAGVVPEEGLRVLLAAPPSPHLYPSSICRNKDV